MKTHWPGYKAVLLLPPDGLGILILCHRPNDCFRSNSAVRQRAIDVWFGLFLDGHVFTFNDRFWRCGTESACFADVRYVVKSSHGLSRSTNYQ
jgi:hypothetical protein